MYFSFATHFDLIFQICSLHSIPRPSRSGSIREISGKTYSYGANDIRGHCDSRRFRPCQIVGDWCREPCPVIREMEGTYRGGLSRSLTGTVLSLGERIGKVSLNLRMDDFFCCFHRRLITREKVEKMSQVQNMEK